MKSRDKHDRVGCKQRAFEYSEILRFLVTQPGRRSIHRSIVPQDRGGDCRSAGRAAIRKEEEEEERKKGERERKRKSKRIKIFVRKGEKEKRENGKLIHRRNLSFERLSLLHSHAFRSWLRAIQLFPLLLSLSFFLKNRSRFQSLPFNARLR